MSELLLEKKLRDSAEEDEVRKIARVRTLTVLRGLDPIRKASVIQFLYESSLIGKDKCIIGLLGADLSGADLIDADLSGANLNRADLSLAKLGRVNLRRAKLIDADLREADLSLADLSGATFSGTNLSGADLNLATFIEADLKGALGVPVEKLERQAGSLRDATMPGGSKHP
jgi:uncharacterized protein YjbI with pentapeptide repeats